MTYATVMVSLALDQSNEARLEAAGQFAERFDAGIVGIVAAQFSPPLYFTTGEQAQNLIDQGRASINKRISELEAQFREATKNRARHIEWRCAIDFPARYILQEARCADIIVSGGQNGGLSDPFMVASPKDLVMQAGRPLFVVPDNVDWLDLRSVLVAWKDTRRRDGRSPIPCRCCARPGTSRSRRSWSRLTVDRRPRLGSGMSWPGCRVTALLPPNWYPTPAWTMTSQFSWMR